MKGKTHHDMLTTEEQRIYELAFQLSDQIKAKDGTTKNEKGEIERNHQGVEYLGLIYRDGNELKITKLYTSNHSSRVENSHAIADAGGAENIVGVVHNHPEAHVKVMENRDGVTRETAEAANRLPSKGDWKDMAEEYFKGRKDVTLFILDHDGELRAFDTERQRKWLTEVDGEWRGSMQTSPPSYHSPRPLDRSLLMAVEPSEQNHQGAPTSAATPETPPTTPQQSSRESQYLYAQATERQLPTMQQFSTDDQQRMCAHAVYLGAQRGWSEIEGVAPNNATAHHRAGEFLCVAGKSSNPDPSVNGVAVQMEDALKASPGEWLSKADTARQEYAIAQTQAETQQMTRSQEQSQSMEQGMVHRLVL